MDFFERQEQARRRTKWLILYFVLAVASIVVMVYGVALIVSFYVSIKLPRHDFGGEAHFQLWNLKLLFSVAVGTLAVIFCGSAWKTMALSGGGGAVAESLGGRLIASNTTDLDERKLLNVVEEMAIASGVPVPQVYVLDEEKGINAFAAGHSASDAAVAVTHGALRLLSRNELQGVIGHEFSHILNGDMRLNLRLVGILFGILCLSAIGRVLLQARSSNSRDRNPLPVVGLLLLVVGSIGVFFGRLIQAAVSRQREFLADASAVQFTRNPGGLAGALKKIGGYSFRSWVVHAEAPDVGHLFFANGEPRSFLDGMATHPPLEQRIRALDPAWDGQFPRVSPQEIMAEDAGRPSKPIPYFAGGKLVAVAIAGAAAAGKPRTVLPYLGNPAPQHLKYAEELRDALPDNLRAAAREPLDAAALVCALLLAADEKLRGEQIAEIARRFSLPVAEKTAALFPGVRAVALRARLPLVNLAIGSLRQLSSVQFARFNATLQWLVDSDGRTDLFEFVLQKIVRRHLAVRFEQARPPVVQFYTLKPLLPDCALVLSALAGVGGDAAAAQKAFHAGVPYLRAAADVELGLLPLEECAVDRVGAALDRLGLAAPIIRKNFIEAAARVAGADGVMQEAEAELLRAVADTLDCPLPPWADAG